MRKIRYFVVAAPAVFTECYSMCIDEHGDRVSEKTFKKRLHQRKLYQRKNSIFKE